jgi:hypothetical protein
MNDECPPAIALFHIDADYLSLQHYLKHIKLLLPRGMSGQVEQGILN